MAAIAVVMLAATFGCSDDDSDTATETTASDAESQDLLGPDDPASGEPVKIGLVSDGGTAAFDNADELLAGQAAADYYNAHKAGVGGRPIDLVTCETGGTPEGATTCGNEMIGAGVVAVALSQSAVTGVLWTTLHEAGVPAWFTQASGDEMEVDEKSTFMVVNPNAAFFGLPVAAAEAEDVKNLAFVVIDVPQAVEILEGDGAQLLRDAGYEFEVFRVPVGTADMTSQMQQVAESGAGVVQVVGNDAFCIAAFQGLNAVAFDGTVTAISQCVTDATREALGAGLEGLNVYSTLALGATDDPTYQLYEAVMAEYGPEVEDVNNLISIGGYAAVASLATALQDIDGADVSIDSVLAAIRSMPNSEFPGGGGMMYQCGGSAVPTSPPVCTNQWLRTELDAEGNPTTYTVEDSSGLFG